MDLSTWLGLAEDPAVLDRFGAVPAALARQIARDAARDHPTTTTWRCIVTGDDHRSVLAVADPMRTPHHDPPPRLARLVDTTYPRCTFPGCTTVARRCDRDHRIPYEEGGATCSCNLQALCRPHHRLKTAGLIAAHPVDRGPDEAGDDAEAVPTDSFRWTTVSGRDYRYDAAPPVPERADRHEQAFATTRHRKHRREDVGPMTTREEALAEGDITRTDDLSWRELVRPPTAPAQHPTADENHGGDDDGTATEDRSTSGAAAWDEPPPF